MVGTVSLGGGLHCLATFLLKYHLQLTYVTHFSAGFRNSDAVECRVIIIANVIMSSSVRLSSVVCNIGAPYSDD